MERKIIFNTSNLSKSYKDLKVLNNVSMNIYEGDIYGFVGENGAGKTTLIRLVCGLIKPESGNYSLFGVQNDDPNIYKAKRNVSAIVESVSINKGFTALDNLKLQCMIAGVTKTDDELKNILSDVGLNYAEIATKKAGKFSLGMRQRLGLAIALLSDPKFILLDEPMNGLDPQGFVVMREAILRLNKKGVTFLISSHILSELEKICTRVGFLSHGRLLQEVSIEELRNLARKKIVIRVKNTIEVCKALLLDLKLNDVKIEGDTIVIYDLISINEIMTYLVSKNIEIEGITTNEDTIEQHYAKIMNGGLY